MKTIIKSYHNKVHTGIKLREYKVVAEFQDLQIKIFTAKTEERKRSAS